MGRRGVWLGVAALACSFAPAALAQRPVSVGYSSPLALRGLAVLTNVPQLRIAEISTPNITALRRRSGILWVHRPVARHHLGTSALTITADPLEWELAATRSNLVPASVLKAASSITIGVIDTGADLTAPSLAMKDPLTYNDVTGTTVVSDANGHGTFVASVAAGGQAGALTGFGGSVKLLIVQADTSPSVFTDVDEAAGIVWAVDNGAKILNLSIGGTATSQVEQDAINYAVSHGALIVAAAGNSGLSGNAPSYPAALLGSNGLAVGAATKSGARASFSTVAPYISILAPGVHVLGATSTSASPTNFPRARVSRTAGVYAYGSGTSYSAPQVAGAAALVWATDPGLSAAQVVQVLEQTARGTGIWNAGSGWGELDVAAAVARAMGLSSPAPVRTTH